MISFDLRRWLRLLVFVGMGLAVSSCVEDINLDTKEGRIITVNCILRNDSVQTLYLNYSKPTMNDEFVPITDADITLFCNGNKIGKFGHIYGKEYFIEHTPVENGVYSLQVICNDKDTLTASTVFPSSINVTVKPYPYKVNFGGTDERMEGFPELPNSGDVFGGIGVGIDCDRDCIVWMYVLKTGKEGYGREIASLIACDHKNKDIFNLSDSTIRDFGIANFNGLDPYVGYDRIAGYAMASNFKGGFEGAADYPLHRCHLRIDHPKDYIRYLDFTSSARTPGMVMDSTRLFRIAGTFRRNHADLVTMNVSDEYDKYLKGSIELLNRKLGEDFTAIYNTDNVYTNVTNGSGIFGAAYISELEDFSKDIVLLDWHYDEYDK